MFELPAARYPATRAGLNYELPITIQLQPSSCVFLKGDNGAGKTTFLEEILLPKIRKSFSLIYLAQDIELQQNSMLATLALLNHTAPTELPKLITAWVRAADNCEVIVLDEIDKYFGPTLAQEVGLARFHWAFTVSHMNLQAPYHVFTYGYALHCQRKQTNTVILNLEQLW